MLIFAGIFDLVLRSLHTESSFFRIPHPIPIKMNDTDAKTQKIESDLNLFMTEKSFGGIVQT